MTQLKTIKIILIFLMVFSFGFALIPHVQAKETCACFCTSDEGVIGGIKQPIEACLNTCASIEEKMVACAYNLEQYPGNDLKCFTEAECLGNWDKKQTPSCPNGTRWCYAKPKPINLTIGLPIGGKELITQVDDLGNYIDFMYQFLLGIATTIAIVLIMVGGLQYVLSAGSGDVSKAKERIKNSMIGLVLLMGAYLILFTVNPDLVKLTVPQLPMVRAANLNFKTRACEDIEKLNFKIVPEGSRVCGSYGKVTRGPDGKPLSGLSCHYNSCSSKDETCINKELMEGKEQTASLQNTCYSCKKLISDNEAGIEITPQLCKSIPKRTDGVAGERSEKICTYSDDSCFEATVYCESSTFQTEGCSGYDKIILSNDRTPYMYISDAEGIDHAALLFISLCTEDPCQAGGTGDNRCVIHDDRCVTIRERDN
ncbi:pilin [Patescibacteria group bacterium]